MSTNDSFIHLVNQNVEEMEKRAKETAMAMNEIEESRRNVEHAAVMEAIEREDEARKESQALHNEKNKTRMLSDLETYSGINNIEMKAESRIADNLAAVISTKAKLAQEDEKNEQEFVEFKKQNCLEIEQVTQDKKQFAERATAQATRGRQEEQSKCQNEGRRMVENAVTIRNQMERQITEEMDQKETEAASQLEAVQLQREELALQNAKRNRKSTSWFWPSNSKSNRPTKD